MSRHALDNAVDALVRDLRVFTVTVPDPRGGGTLPHRVVCVVDRDGTPRFRLNHQMTIRELIEELWYDPKWPGRWKPWGAPLGV